MSGASLGEMSSPTRVVNDDSAGPRILLVEDPSPMRNALGDAMRADGFDVHTEGVTSNSLAILFAWNPDLVLLDLTAKGASGLSICRRIRELTTTPVVVVSSPGDEALVIEALEMGAVDYLTWPFELDALKSRVRVALAQSADHHFSQGSSLEVGPLLFHLARRQISVRGSLVHFPKREYDLTLALAVQARNILTRRDLMDRVWGRFNPDTKTLDAHILRIRHKVELEPHTPVHVITVRGFGYLFDPGDSLE